MKEFYPFRLDIGNQCLWRRSDHGDDERILLKPKAFAILQYLVDHAGRLVTQGELLAAVWPDTWVQRDVLKRHIVDIRNLLGDDSRRPAYIETRPWRGYQFIAAVCDVACTAATGPDFPARTKLVGRDQALADLRACLGRALGCQRQVVFVTGEPAIGMMTALVDEFQRQAAAAMPIRIARGQCMEGYGGNGPYCPMPEALGNLCRGPGGAPAVRILAAQAPAWLVQFPSLKLGEPGIPGAPRQRMLREIGEALETIASETPLLLVLEDIHLADSSTVDLISSLARGRRAAKLMVVATYRAAGLTLSGHPLEILERDLLVHRLCHELVLESVDDLKTAGYRASEPRDAEKEIEKLLRLRKHIDMAIADLKRLDAGRVAAPSTISSVRSG